MSVAHEIAKAKALLDDGLISEAEFSRLKARALEHAGLQVPQPRQQRRARDAWKSGAGLTAISMVVLIGLLLLAR